MAIESVNPATGKRVSTFLALSEREIADKLARAERAARSWRTVPIDERTAMVRRAGGLLDERKHEYGALMTLEMGKPIKGAIEEAAKCAASCRFYADHAPRFLANEPVEAKGERSHVAYQPLGVILAVMPWNFPFWQVIRFAAPALAAGNVGLLKHASNVPQCALALEQLFSDAGAPPGVFQTLLVGSDSIGMILADDRVAAATLTGSEGAGSSVASIAGKHIKKTVLELGGSDPFIIMATADVNAAVTAAVKARVINNGQSCIAAKRFIVDESIADDFSTRFVERMRGLVVGNPMDAATDIGPLATQQIRDDVDDQVQRSVAAGAKLLLGGHRRDGAGYFYEPTVLTNVMPGSPVFREETFGPVAAIIRSRDLDHAIELANDSRFGLAASAWTREESEMEEFGRRLDAGSVFINGMVASDPRFPFGGIKKSGYGRELSAFGIREFVNIKTVRIMLGEQTAGRQTSTE